MSDDNEVMALLETYDKYYPNFTYAHPDDPEHLNALQVGFVGIFYLKKSWSKRSAIAELLGLFAEEFGDHLQYGHFAEGEPMEDFNRIPLSQRQQNILDLDPDDVLEMTVGNAPSPEYVNDYMFHIFSTPKWDDDLRNKISPVKIYFPIECLRNLGIDRVIGLIKTFAEKLQPLHGMAGLALQQTLQWESYQYLEYPLAWRYRGLDISNVDFDRRFNHGLKAVNWLNILSDTLLNEKFVGLEGLKSRNRDHSVNILPYRGGVIVQAGEVPTLGEEAHDPYPVHYVNANLLLKPARAPEIGSLGIGSNRGEIRFNPITTKQWQERFDLPDDEGSLEKDEHGKARVSVFTGTLVEHSGLYGAMVKGVAAYQYLSEGSPAPDSSVALEADPEALTWYLLKTI